MINGLSSIEDIDSYPITDYGRENTFLAFSVSKAASKSPNSFFLKENTSSFCCPHTDLGYGSSVRWPPHYTFNPHRFAHRPFPGI